MRQRKRSQMQASMAPLRALTFLVFITRNLGRETVAGILSGNEAIEVECTGRDMHEGDE